MNRIVALIAAVAVLLIAEASAFAMTFTEPEEIIQAAFDPENRCVRGKER